MIDLVTAIRSVRAEMNIATAMPLVLVWRLRRDRGAGRPLGRESFSGSRGSRTSRSRSALPRARCSSSCAARWRRLPLKGVIDFAAEQARLEKEMARVQSDIARIDAKLGNADFVARAPEEVVEGEREKRDEAEARRLQNHRRRWSG